MPFSRVERLVCEPVKNNKPQAMYEALEMVFKIPPIRFLRDRENALQYLLTRGGRDTLPETQWSVDGRLLLVRTHRSGRVIQLQWHLARQIRKSKIIGLSVDFGTQGSIKAAGEVIGRMIEARSRALITVHLVDNGGMMRFFAADWPRIAIEQRLPIAVDARLMQSFESQRWRKQHPEFAELWSH